MERLARWWWNVIIEYNKFKCKPGVRRGSQSVQSAISGSHFKGDLTSAAISFVQAASVGGHRYLFSYQERKHLSIVQVQIHRNPEDPNSSSLFWAGSPFSVLVG